MIKRIVIELVDHANQRYNTVGDWYLEGPTLVIKGSKLPLVKGNRIRPWVLNWAVPLHELCEALTALSNGVTVEEVDDFDKQFELDHADDDDEPGDDPRCPVHKQHQFACMVEEAFIKMIPFDWESYVALQDEPFLARRKAEAKARKQEKKHGSAD